eukprot:scaffold2117_cov241-Pinguiococcus_pyrenoidosus.AAC.9
MKPRFDPAVRQEHHAAGCSFTEGSGRSRAVPLRYVQLIPEAKRSGGAMLVRDFPIPAQRAPAPKKGGVAEDSLSEEAVTRSGLVPERCSSGRHGGRPRTC